MNRTAALMIAAGVSVIAVGAYGLRRAPWRPAASTSGPLSSSTTPRHAVSGPGPTAPTPSGTTKGSAVTAAATAHFDSPSVADALVEQALAVPPDRVAEAKQLLRDALDANPHHVGALRELSRIRLDDEAFDDAIDLANRCLEAQPTNADCTALRLMALGRSGRGDVDATERAYQERPDDFGRVQGLAQARLAEGRVAEARALIEKMRALNPESPLVPTMAGAASLRAGDARLALAEFEAGCRLGQEFACASADRLRAPASP